MMQLNNRAHLRMLYGAWAVGVFLACLYALFPTQALKHHVAAQIANRLPGVEVRIEKLSLGLPPGFQLKEVAVFQTDRPLLDLERVKITPKWLSLFGSETEYRFSAQACGGAITGEARVPKTDAPKNLAAQAELSGLELKQVAFLRERLPFEMIGRLSGTVDVAAPYNLAGQLTIVDCQVDLKTALLKNSNLAFRRIEADLTLQGNRLEFRRLKMNGKQLDAELAGTIFLAPRSGNESLNLSGTVVPRPELLAALGGFPQQLLATNKRPQGRIPVTITGNLERPALTFN
jgi:type II secretion system protein N